VVEAVLVDEIAAAMNRYFFGYDESPLLVVNTSEIDQVEGTAHLDEIVAVIRKTKAGVTHVQLGSI
jgi:hypothetical protein